MQVSVESTSALERRMTVEVPEDRINSEVENRLKSIARTARMDGFRPGKVPFSVVRKRYEGQVMQEVIGEVIQSTFYEAVSKENLQPVGAPSIEPKSVDEGKGLSYEAIFEVYPEFELAAMDGIEIEKPAVEITEADVDRMVEKVRKQRAEWKEADRAAVMGDRVVIDFKGSIDGEEFPGGAGENMPVELGSGRMIAGFEEQLVGVKAGDERTLELTFPEDYHAKNLAGKDVSFATTTHKVEEAALPELDEEFAKSLGIEEGGVDGLREQIKQSMQMELDNALRSNLKQQVAEKLVALNDIALPKSMVQQDVDNAAQRIGLTADKLSDDQREKMTPAAQQRVATGLIFSEIIKNNNLSVPAERVRTEIEKMASTYDEPQQVIDWYYGDKNRLAEIEAIVLEDMIVDFVLDAAKVNEVQSSFEEVVKV